MDFEMAKLLNDIKERQNIINTYQANATLDRNYVIKLIIDKRKEDPKVGLLMIVDQCGKATVPLEQVTNEGLIHELQVQIDTLEAELLDKSRDG